MPTNFEHGQFQPGGIHRLLHPFLSLPQIRTRWSLTELGLVLYMCWYGSCSIWFMKSRATACRGRTTNVLMPSCARTLDLKTTSHGKVVSHPSIQLGVLQCHLIQPQSLQRGTRSLDYKDIARQTFHIADEKTAPLTKLKRTTWLMVIANCLFLSSDHLVRADSLPYPSEKAHLPSRMRQW